MSMDFSQIKELIALLQNSNVGEFSLKQKDFSLNIRTDKYISDKSGSFVPSVAVAPAPAPVAATPQPAVVEKPAVTAPETTPAPKAEEKKAATNYIEIKSPMVGTFYRASSPEKPPFAKVGDTIGVDSVLCLIEAMKLFNEVRSEVSGRIVKVLIDNASPVEYDQPLFLVEPI